jgi:hypothetical protein
MYRLVCSSPYRAQSGIHRVNCSVGCGVKHPERETERRASNVQWHTQEFCSGVQQIQLRTEGRENGDLGAVAPKSGGPLNLQSGSTLSDFRDVRMYFPRNWEFGSALSKLRNFGGRGDLNLPNPPPPLGTPLLMWNVRITPLLSYVLSA